MNQNDLNDFDMVLSEMLEKRKDMKIDLINSQNNWFEMLKITFESSAYRTLEYLKFHRLFKKQFTKTLKEIGAIQVQISKPNHFDANGFFKMANGQIFWFSISDLRWSKDSLLVRTAKDFKDYSGGQNQFCKMNGTYDRFLGDLKFICRGSRND